MKAERFARTVLLASFLLVLCNLPGAARDGAANSPGAAPAQPPGDTSALVQPNIVIPGPLRSFLRMAAISQKVSPDQVLALLARNVTMEGYGWRGRTPEPTEYLILLKGYLEHARELKALAGPQGVIRVSNCTEAQPLLAILGYRFKAACGPDAAIVASDAKKAFLTIDSGFPLTDLEESLQQGKAFSYGFTSAQLPVLFTPQDWITNQRIKGKARKLQPRDLVDSLVGDPAMARLYWALDRMDPATRGYLRRSPGLKKLVPYASVLNFYGTDIYVRSGRVVTPGGPAADAAWRSLVGARPTSPSAFIMHLLSRDQGWLAAYFDALSRADDAQQAYLTEPRHLRAFYSALRGRNPFPSPVRPVFRPDPGLMLLATQLQLDSNGEPHLPGGLETWKEILSRGIKSHSKTVREWSDRTRGWKNPDQLVAAMFAFSRVQSEDSPLRLYLVLSEMDRRRSPEQQLKPETVLLLAQKFSRYGDQYPMFSEFRNLDDSSILRFLSVAEDLGRIRDRTVRADAVGVFQANAGLWQIMARQGEIPVVKWNTSWDRVIHPFAGVRTEPEVFDAARSSLGALVRAAAGSPYPSEEEIVDLLAGPSQSSADGQRVRQRLAYRIRSVLDAQRLVSIDVLFSLGAGLQQMAHGQRMPRNLLQLAGALREFRMPKPLFSSSERAEWSYGLYSNPHIQSEMTTNLAKLLKAPRTPRQLEVARGQLVPFLRDSLVGLNYAYYQPPGAQVLYNSAYFVRSHDFSGEAIMGRDQSWRTPTILGRGWTASGGAHLVGSLVDLPYVLAEVEQDFIVPRNVQALIWEDLVPTLLTDSIVPRWWHVTPQELHAVALYQKFGEELITAATRDQTIHQRVVSILSGRTLPEKSAEIQRFLREGRADEAVSQMTAAGKFYLAAAYRQGFPRESAKWDPAGQELDKLARQYPNQVSWARISKDFGVPHPALAETYACELLNVKPFPTFLGYSSRLLAESWQSNNLYWARLADQSGYSPVMLNLLVPSLTRQMVANIFATDLQDRPALLRAMRETGEEFRQGLLASSLPKSRRVGSGS